MAVVCEFVFLWEIYPPPQIYFTHSVLFTLYNALEYYLVYVLVE